MAEQPRAQGGTFESKLTEELADAIIESVKAGLFDQQIAHKNGIDVTTLKSWVERGLDEEAREPFKRFAERYVKEAIALEERLLGSILKAAEPWVMESDALEIERSTKGFDGHDDDIDSTDAEPYEYTKRKTKKARQARAGDWKASAWILERRWPLRWGITRQPEGGPKEAIRLPEAQQNRNRRVKEMTTAPPPELIKAFREAGYDIVRREKPS